MALAKVVAGKSLLIKVSSGGGSPTFAHSCLVNAARGIVFTAQTNETRIPDCTDPELIAWTKKEKISLSASVNGQGVLHTTDTEMYFNWLASPLPIAARIELSGVTLANGGGYWSANWHLTNFEVSGDIGSHVQASIGLESDGDVVWVDAAA
jgi:hypothetical protein